MPLAMTGPQVCWKRGRTRARGVAASLARPVRRAQGAGRERPRAGGRVAAISASCPRRRPVRASREGLRTLPASPGARTRGRAPSPRAAADNRLAAASQAAESGRAVRRRSTATLEPGEPVDLGGRTAMARTSQLGLERDLREGDDPRRRTRRAGRASGSAPVGVDEDAADRAQRVVAGRAGARPVARQALRRPRGSSRPRPRRRRWRRASRSR